MKHLVLLFLLLTFNIYSQDLEKIKKDEVLFIYYSDDEYESKQDLGAKNKSKRHDIIYFYKFNETDNRTLGNHTIEIVFNQFYDFDEMFKNNPVPFFKLNKSFLKKNKDIIINREFMHKIGYNESFSLIQNAKTIFMIDKDDIDNNMITVKKVRLANIAEE